MVFNIVPSKALRLTVAGCNAMTWISSVIVVGITGYFLNDYPHDQHLIFEMCIVSFFPQSLNLCLPTQPVRHCPWSLAPLLRAPRP
jgi:hypothetical protein